MYILRVNSTAMFITILSCCPVVDLNTCSKATRLANKLDGCF